MRNVGVVPGVIEFEGDLAAVIHVGGGKLAGIELCTVHAALGDQRGNLIGGELLLRGRGLEGVVTNDGAGVENGYRRAFAGQPRSPSAVGADKGNGGGELIGLGLQFLRGLPARRDGNAFDLVKRGDLIDHAARRVDRKAVEEKLITVVYFELRSASKKRGDALFGVRLTLRERADHIRRSLGVQRTRFCGGGALELYDERHDLVLIDGSRLERLPDRVGIDRCGISAGGARSGADGGDGSGHYKRKHYAEQFLHH